MTILRKIRVAAVPALLTLAAVTVSSCTCHHEDEPLIPFKVGHVLCTDGTIMSLCDYVKSTKDAVGIVFHVSEDPENDVLGHAVYIYQPESVAFAESCGIAQGTSMSLAELDGNANTYSIYTSDGVKSPMASMVFDLWTYGQSAYVPSVAELRLLRDTKDFVNERIEAVGGDPIKDDDENCWLWSSTEVNGQQENKAWLFSMNYGAIQETPKDQVHNVRPIIAIRR